MGSGVYGMSWEPWPPARHTSARAAWRPQNLDDSAMKKILVGAAACGCRRGPSGAGKTEITDSWCIRISPPALVLLVATGLVIGFILWYAIRLGW